MPVTPELVVVRSPTATATTSSSSSKSGGIVVPGRGGSHLPRRASHRPDSRVRGAAQYRSEWSGCSPRAGTARSFPDQSRRACSIASN